MLYESKSNEMEVKAPQKIPIKLGYIELPLLLKFKRIIRMAIVEVKVGSIVKRELIYRTNRLKLNFIIENPRPGLNTLEIRIVQGPRVMYCKKLNVEFVDDPLENIIVTARRISDVIYDIIVEFNLKRRVDSIELKLNRYDPYTLLPLSKPITFLELKDLDVGKYNYSLGRHDLTTEHELHIVARCSELTWDRSIFIPSI